MAGIQLSLIQSRVGRRVAGLFVLCGLLPLLVLSGFTSWTVSSYLHEQEQERLRARAKASAMTSLERLLDVESQLRARASSPTTDLTTGRIRGVSALGRLAADGRVTPLFGRLTPVTVSPIARDRLAAGEAALLPPAGPAEPLLLAVPTSGDRRAVPDALIAALDARTLWALDEQASDGRGVAEVCAAVSGGGVLGCTDPRLHDAARAALSADTTGTGAFRAMVQDEEWMGRYWSAPTQAPYGVPRWTSIVVSRTADAVAPVRGAVETVGLTVVATICLTLLVSFSQIRRLLDPIGRLQEGTSRLARGEFAVRVDVRTGDELQALGDAFNLMAGDLQRHFEQLQVLSVGTLEALARAIDAKSSWTAGHSTRVAEIAVAIGQAMHYDPPSLDRLRRGGLLHDIGKIGVSAAILDSPAPLTAEQRAIVEQHPTLGARILEPLPHCADLLPMVLQHHERFDGAGYPAGLAGAGIAPDARIMAVADVYDAMTSERPYRRGVASRDAAVWIAEGAGTQFDPDVVAAFMVAFRNRRLPCVAGDSRVSRGA
jgi:putative nucleotidyltransferase with HDIG domain